MTALHEILDREAERISATPKALDTILDLKDRRERRHRIEAIALVVVLCGALAAAAGLIDRFGASPASPGPGYQHNGDIAVFQEVPVDGPAEARVATVDPVSRRAARLPITGVDIAGSRFTTQPSWSPDGSSIAYLLTNELWILDVLTGEARELARCESCGGSPAWSPDGTTLAVAGGAVPGRIFLFDVNTGQASSISLMEPWGAYTSPAWSPDGESIAFISHPLGAEPVSSSRCGATDPTSDRSPAARGWAWHGRPTVRRLRT